MLIYWSVRGDSGDNKDWPFPKKAVSQSPIPIWVGCVGRCSRYVLLLSAFVQLLLPWRGGGWPSRWSSDLVVMSERLKMFITPMAQVMVGKGSDVVGIYLGCFSDFSWIITAFFNGIGIPKNTPPWDQGWHRPYFGTGVFDMNGWAGIDLNNPTMGT